MMQRAFKLRSSEDAFASRHGELKRVLKNQVARRLTESASCTSIPGMVVRTETTASEDCTMSSICCAEDTLFLRATCVCRKQQSGEQSRSASSFDLCEDT